MKKILKIIVMIIVLMMFFMTISYGSLEVENLTGNQQSMSGLKGIGNYVVSIITTIGIVVSVIVIAVIGIKYMLGSAGERAEYKKTLLPYLIGAALTFGASTFAQIIYLFVK